MKLSKKLAFVVLTTLFMFSIASAESIDISPNTFEYTSQTTIETIDVGAAPQIKVSACGQTKPIGNMAIPTKTYTLKIPDQFPCGLGTHNVQVYFKNSNTLIGQEDITITPKNMDPHKGQHLYLVSDIKAGEEGKMTDFMLSNDVWSDTISPFWGKKKDPSTNPCVTLPGGDPCYNSAVLIEEIDSPDGNEYAAWNPAFGGQIERSPTDTLESIVEGNIYEGKESYQGGSVADGDCSDDPCDIGTTPFTTSNVPRSNLGKYARNLDSATPVHTRGKRMPDGDIVYGAEPEYYDSSGEQFVDSYDYNPSRKFFICRDGATMENGFGDEVPQVVDTMEDFSNQELIQCEWSKDWSGGKYDFRWESVGECNDGIDNDGDGKIDHPDSYVTNSAPADPSCASKTDTESGPDKGDCVPAAANNGTNYVAYYGGFPDSDGYCDGSDGKKQTFAEWTASLEGGSAGTPPDATVHTCDDGAGHSYCENKDYYIHDEDLDKSGAQIYYAKYYPTEGYLQDVIPYDLGTIYGEKTESYFVNGSGWTPARMALDGSSFSGEGTKPSLRQGAERIYGAVDASTHRHSDSFWFNTKGMVDGDGNGYQDGSYDDSWVVANAGAPNNDQVSSEFPGGWAGKCPQGTEWRKESGSSGQEWRCSGEPDWKQAVFLPQITQGTNKIGIIVMPYNFKDVDAEPTSVINLGLSSWKTAYDGVADNTATSDETLDQMKVSCYPGETAPDYSTATEGQDYFNETVSIPGTDVENPVGVSGTVDMSGHSTYTCEWSYTTAGGEKVNGIGCVIELQNSDSECVGNFGDIKDYYMGTEGSDPVEFPDGTVLERDTKYSSEQVTELTN